VPATSERFIKKAALSAADAIFLDLEDAVIPELKVKARAMAVQALNEVDWGTKTVSVRVNALDTEWGFRDIIAVAEACPRLDRILLPKCDSPAHVHTVEMLLASLEQGLGASRTRPIALEALIETASGMANVEAIASTGTRLEALIFGAGDYQLDMRIYERSVGAPSADYVVLTDGSEPSQRQRHWNDPWHFALARVANACRANGIVPVDGPFTNIADPEGFKAATLRSAALGFEGKWAIHPTQIETANEVFSPSPAQLQWAHEVLEVMEAARREGRGAVKTRNGDMVDMAHLKMAKAILARAELLGDRPGATR
jgi:malyl-CoA/(S)-citramalyl-CoA lyase